MLLLCLQVLSRFFREKMDFGIIISEKEVSGKVVQQRYFSVSVWLSKY